MKTNRHLCREFALQTLFGWEARGRQHVLVDLMPDYNEHFFHVEDEDGLEFTKLILEGVEDHVKQIEKYISKYAPDWPLEKISLIDRCILYIGVFELVYNTDVPDVVAINEAVELAKKFGNETSSRFINGVLNSIYQDKKNP